MGSEDISWERRCVCLYTQVKSEMALELLLKTESRRG